MMSALSGKKLPRNSGNLIFTENLIFGYPNKLTVLDLQVQVEEYSKPEKLFQLVAVVTNLRIVTT